MRNISKMTTLENKFPLLAVEQGCIISKDADITVAFEVELPELYTVTGAEYEAIHGCWCKAIKVLPDFSVVHKQDWFIKEKYRPELQKEDMSFLSRSFERHFNERPYLKHTCYLYLTKTTKERNRMQSNFSTLCRGHIIPKELDKETAAKFMEAAEQFERIINDSGFVRLRRLSTDEIVGTEGKTGLIERYFSLMPEGDRTLQDIDLSAREMRIGDNRLCLHTLSDAEDLPGKVSTDVRYEKLSSAGKSAPFPGIAAQYSVAASTVLWRGLHSIMAIWLPTSLRMFFTSIGLSVHAIMLQWARTEVSPNECASFRYRSIHSLLIWLLREYFESDCMLRADFSNFCKASSLLFISTYWL